MPDRIDKEFKKNISDDNSSKGLDIFDRPDSINPSTKGLSPLPKTDSSKPEIVKDSSPLPTDLKVGGSAQVQKSVAEHPSPNASPTDSKISPLIPILDTKSQHIEPSTLANLNSDVLLSRPENSPLADHTIRAEPNLKTPPEKIPSSLALTGSIGPENPRLYEQGDLKINPADGATRSADRASETRERVPLSAQGNSPNGQSALKSLSPGESKHSSLIVPNVEFPNSHERDAQPVPIVQAQILPSEAIKSRRVEDYSTSTTSESKIVNARNVKIESQSESSRAPYAFQTEGKIAGTRSDPISDSKPGINLSKLADKQSGQLSLTPPERSAFSEKIPEGTISDSKHDPLNTKALSDVPAKPILKTDERTTPKPADKASTDKPDTKTPTDKPTHTSSGPSAFIQFIENQAGIRGPSFPSVDKSEKGKKDYAEPGKDATKGQSNKADDKATSKQDPTKSDANKTNAKSDTLKPDGSKPPAKIDATRTGPVRNDSVPAAGPKMPGVNLDGLKNRVDGFLGIVDTVKENLKGTFKGNSERRPLHLAEGELLATALKGQLPPLRDRITSAQSIAVWFPAGIGSWNIVRSPSLKPDTSRPAEKPISTRGVGSKPLTPAPVREPMANQPAKPFDINNPPDKLRPFIQLHGADSDYKGGDNRPANSPPKFDAVKWEPIQTSKQPQIPDAVNSQKNLVDPGRITEPEKSGPNQSDTVKTSPLKSDTSKPTAAPYLDLPGKIQPKIDQTNQGSTRPSSPVVSPELAERRRLAEEQENTVRTSDESTTEATSNESSADELPAEELKVRDQLALSEHDKRMRYVNSDIDAQESTWNSEEQPEEQPHISMSRYAYIVRSGDTVESVAVAELKDLRLAPLLYSKNRKYVLPEAEYGIHPFLEGVVIDLPTPAEIAAFRQL